MKNKIGLFFVLIILSACLAGCAGSSGSGPDADAISSKPLDTLPSIANVRVSGGSDYIVVTYDVTPGGADSTAVRLLYSLDGGKNFQAALKVEGQTSEVSAGRERTLKWNALGEAPGARSGLILRVMAVRGQAAGPSSDSLPFATNVPSTTPGGAEHYRIAFISDRDLWKKAFVMNSDGSSQQKIFPGNYNEFYASLAPDGGKLVFVSDREGSSEIFIADSGGAFIKRLTFTKDIALARGGYSYPSFSSDGRTIAFIKNFGNGKLELDAMGSDGGGIRKLYDGGIVECPVSLSPDGSKAAFTVSGDQSNYDIYTASSSGSGASKLTNSSYNIYCMSPCFSPDGSRIAFISTRDGNPEVYIMNSGGENVIRLTYNAFADSAPCFSPDGSRVIFASDDGTGSFISSVPAAGGASKKISDNNFHDIFPSAGSGFVIMSRPSRTLVDINVSGITLNGFSADLSSAKCYAFYSDNTSTAVNPIWTVVSGGGTISNNVYLASPSAKKAVLRASYTENGVTKSRDAAINLSGESRIYFSDGGLMYSVRPDGTGLKKLTSFDRLDVGEAVFSPDGKNIVFTASNGKTADLYYMDARTFRRVRLTNNSRNNYNPSFSPDGGRIVFSSSDTTDPRSFGRDLSYIDVKTLATRKLSNAYYNAYGCYSPDGSKIAFESYLPGTDETGIYTIDADGNNLLLLSSGDGHNNGYPRYLKDGRIVFNSDRDGNSQIYVMNPDGSGAVNLNNDKEDNFPA